MKNLKYYQKDKKSNLYGVLSEGTVVEFKIDSNAIVNSVFPNFDLLSKLKIAWKI